MTSNNTRRKSQKKKLENITDAPAKSVGVNVAIDQIIVANERIRRFWTEEASGWSPQATAELLENSRLDRLVSLSHSLRLWVEPCADEDQEGRLQSGNPGRRYDDLVPVRL
jgi:hypothetical protein